MSKHEWNLPAEDDGFPRVLRVAEGEFSGANPEGLLEISGNCGWEDEHLAAEILRLAARVKELEAAVVSAKELNGKLVDRIALADVHRTTIRELEGRLVALEAENAALLAGKFPEVATRIQALAEAKEVARARVEQLEAKLQERDDLLLPVVAPLLPLFRERAESWERSSSRPDNPLPRLPMPEKMTLTAEFPVEALRALTKE